MKRTGILSAAAELTALFLVIAALSPMSVRAKETAATGPSESQLVLETVISGYSAVVEDGKAEVPLTDGTAVSAEGASLTDGLLLMVEEITEENENLFTWLTDCMQGRGTGLRLFDIYLVDNEGNRHELTSQVRVSVSLKGDGSGNLAAFQVTADGNVAEITDSVNGNIISFTAAGGGYYVTADQGDLPPESESESESESGSGSGQDQGGSGQAQNDSGQSQNGSVQSQNQNQNAGGQAAGASAAAQSAGTGDTSQTGLLMGILIAAAAVIAICLVYQKRKSSR